MRKCLRRWAWLVGVVLVGAALYDQLRRPPEERTWHGRVAGVVPYDFRMPTIERLRDAYWNPQDPYVLTDRVFGVGWAVNLYRIYKLASQALGA